MQLVLATSNKGKIREIAQLCDSFEVVAFSDLVDLGEIVEDGDTFAANALIKARTVYNALNDPDAIVLSDDSGISVAALDNAPGIYSARYAGKGATDKDNLNKLVEALKAKGLTESPAFYTAAISIVCREGEYTVHGWMHGKVIDTPRGDGGFGYDPMFIPQGYEQTLGELDGEIKKRISHRSKALGLAKVVLATIRKARH
ncbi:RdgB/HAM1 family non-canonical purine NTP pyrophosphatase [Sulfurimonas sp. HSL-3221]|uniref:RdgB/HAM1 family non-canonical purine NTP pyrophosphatase n=1 Tax=Sulfurimonadaceae TaxID=2771471 RepID=UPI001E57B594|nr:RdgB/HAM1 family non-canonical purine NTP pyrophosphatase [Sulfurimonas sp. HSL-3221]UFS62438.1 RdgB/HAM1 family non-canonical purine NTP pyrophosphatase [Sulfurimonas sp. HSL-3221]